MFVFVRVCTCCQAPELIITWRLREWQPFAENRVTTWPLEIQQNCVPKPVVVVVVVVVVFVVRNAAVFQRGRMNMLPQE